MFARRMMYVALLEAAWFYYISNGAWISWILLLTVLGLPWLSLLLSLPAAVTFQASPAGVDVLEQGEEAELWLLGSCRSPMPRFRGRIRITEYRTGKQWRYETEAGLPTEHCAGFLASVEKARLNDYLGLFSLRIRKTQTQNIVIRPKPLPVSDLIDPQRMGADSWAPKPGGGFSENHEHRLYRPGDKLNQVHWKLSAKTGELIVREPMEPIRGAVLLTVSLRGTPDVMDRKMGRLLWVGRYLLERELEFEIRALTGRGVESFRVSTEAALLKTLDALLCAPEAKAEDTWDADAEASWQYHIGGEADEA